MKTQENIGPAILRRRQYLGISQVELAKEIGRNSMEISHWECGRRIPTIQNLIRLSNVFNCSIDELVS